MYICELVRVCVCDLFFFYFSFYCCVALCASFSHSVPSLRSNFCWFTNYTINLRSLYMWQFKCYLHALFRFGSKFASYKHRDFRHGFLFRSTFECVCVWSALTLFLVFYRFSTRSRIFCVSSFESREFDFPKWWQRQRRWWCWCDCFHYSLCFSLCSANKQDSIHQTSLILLHTYDRNRLYGSQAHRYCLYIFALHTHRQYENWSRSMWGVYRIAVYCQMYLAFEHLFNGTFKVKRLTEFAASFSSQSLWFAEMCFFPRLFFICRLDLVHDVSNPCKLRLEHAYIHIVWNVSTCV